MKDRFDDPSMQISLTIGLYAWEDVAFSIWRHQSQDCFQTSWCKRSFHPKYLLAGDTPWNWFGGYYLHRLWMPALQPYRTLPSSPSCFFWRHPEWRSPRGCQHRINDKHDRSCHEVLRIVMGLTWRLPWRKSGSMLWVGFATRPPGTRSID